jgi:hypothetical protein
MSFYISRSSDLAISYARKKTSSVATSGGAKGASETSKAVLCNSSQPEMVQTLDLFVGWLK